MGIKRCPYCRALISDEDQYCKNCGTQLLFPEDEDLEEEIPGEKILEDDRHQETTENLVEEGADETREEENLEERSSELSEGVDTEEIMEEINEEEKDKEEEVILVEDEDKLEKTGFSLEERLPFPEEKNPSATPDDSENLETGASNKAEIITENLEEKKEGLISKKEEAETSSAPVSSVTEKKYGPVTQILEEFRAKEEVELKGSQEESKPGLVTQLVKELGIEKEEKKKEEKKKESGKETIPYTFKTEELEKIDPTIEMGKRQVEDFLEILEEKERERRKESYEQKNKSEESSEEPGWIKNVTQAELQTGSTELIDALEKKETQEEKIEIVDTETGEEWEEEISSEPTMGFPEKVTRSELELEKEEFREGENMGIEDELKEEESEEETVEDYILKDDSDVLQSEEQSRVELKTGDEKEVAPLGFKNFIKAKIFDLLFIIMFWLISAWLVARSMEATIFKLFDVASTHLLIFLLILTAIYFFLFYFFLGETLGDRLFREEEENWKD